MSEPIQNNNELLTSFYEQNPNFDILNFDFFDEGAESEIPELNTPESDTGVSDTRVVAFANVTTEEVAVDKSELKKALETDQRLLRVYNDKAVAKKLIDKGLTSAHHIAALAEHQFVRDHADAFNGNEEQARQAYQQAVHIKTLVQHLYADVKDMVASPYYQATSFANTSETLSNYYKGIPSYQQLFGSLDYLECDDCQSIFSQSAYFVDIMRIVDQYITDPNTTIPAGYKLEERRPDLFDLPLNCENTTTIIPYLEVVNDVLKQYIEAELKKENSPLNSDAFKTLAVAVYPFNLPFNLPLVQTRRCLTNLKTSLASIYSVLVVPETTADNVVKEINVARESLGLSIEEYGLITTPNSSEENLKRCYGYTGASVNLLEELKAVETFLKCTGLNHNQLEELFTQNLDLDELKAGTANNFFINKTGESGLEYLQTYWDKSNPDKSVEYIKGLSFKRLDRLNRFIRLAKVLGWSYADLDWAFTSYGATEINAQVIIYLAKIQKLLSSTKLPLDVLTSFWSSMKTNGKVNSSNPQDLFNRVFNNPVLLNGQNPYSNTTVPFDPNRNPIQEWQVVETTGANGLIRSRLKAALMLTDGDLTTLANYVLKLLEIPTGKLPLNLLNLTWLYRLSKQSALFELTIDEYLNLLCLIYYPDGSYLSPPKNALPTTVEELIKVKDIVDWLAKFSLSIYQLKYIITGKSSDHFKPGYTTTDIKPLIQKLSVTSEGSRLKPTALIFEDIDTEQAEKIFQNLIQANVITKIGIFLTKITNYDQTASLFPLSKTSFYTPTNSITEAESAAVFNALASQKTPIIIKTGEDSGTLSSTFNNQTNLDFLKLSFTGTDDDKTLKVSKIRAILLQVQRNINHTTEVLLKIESLQEKNILSELSNFLNSPIESLSALLPYAVNRSVLNNYLEIFLTPIKEGIKEQTKVEAFLKTLDQWSLIVANIPLTKTETEAVINESAHFNIADVNKLTLDNVRSLATFKSLVKSLGIQDDSLIAYFKLNKDSQRDKIDALAALTGWKSDQIATLIGLFWPNGVNTSADYDTVAGLLRLKNVFDLGTLLGSDVNFLIRLSSLSHLPINGGANNWDTYNDIASATLQVVNAKYKDTEFTRVYKSITDELNTRKRDSLLGYAIWLIKDPSIEQPSDLYQYLLIDVETSSSTTTSKIAQGIASVQLYMQRCRMMLEPGVNIIKVPEIWWSWISEYRVWEVNRKIFLYPENYIEPSLRKSATPIFKELANALLQTNVTKETVVAPYQEYFKQVSVLGSLIHTSSHHCTRIDSNTGEEKDTLFIIGRTNTDPYTYYFRTLENGNDWTPWEEIKLTIGASNVIPVYGFGRLFIFWTEIDTGKSGSIQGQASSTQTVHKATIKYSFYNFVIKEWVHPQTLLADVVINAFPNDYLTEGDNKPLAPLFDSQAPYWREPYILNTGEGIVGAGTVDLTAGLGVVSGNNSQFKKEIKNGDQIWCAGEMRTVARISKSDELVVTRPWTVNITKAKYKIILKELKARFQPYFGSGTVDVTEGLRNVSGNATQFKNDFAYGDKIVIGDETRLIYRITNDTEILVDQPWTKEYTNSTYTVIPCRTGAERLLVLYGSELKTTSSGQFSKPPTLDNPGKDTFIEQKQTFNQHLFNALRVADDASSKPNRKNIPGYATLGSSTILDSNLLHTETQLLIANYQYSATTNPQPYKPELNRLQARLKIVRSENALVDNYWGNNYPGMSNPTPTSTSSLDLLYYISEQQASLANVTNQPSWFIFNNSDEAFLVQSQEQNLNKLTDMLFIQPQPMLPDMLNNLVVSTGAYTPTPEQFEDLKFKFTRLTTNTISMLNQRLFAGGIDNLLTIESQQLPELPFNRFYPAPGTNPSPAVIPPTTDQMDFEGAFGLYFWEIFFHAPFLIASQLNANKRFDEARLWLQYIFNPTQKPDLNQDPQSSDRFWRFLPFRTMDRESLKEMLQNPVQIKAYNYDPFDPDGIAKSRTVAYAKTIVMKYIDNVLDWADSLFARDTSESINQATNLYVLAANLLGTRPQSRGKLPRPQSKTFRDIKQNYPSEIPQFLIDLENTPEIKSGTQNIQYTQPPFNNINSYFCVPENADFIKYWDRVEDRLYKIRHSMNIEGVVRQLALFAPPIDPRALIRAAADGGGGLSLASLLDAPIPYYRASYMLQKAKELTAQLGNLGAALLSALEKKDAEVLNLLRISQEQSILKLVTTIKEQQIKEIVESQVSLQASLDSAKKRYSYYSDLVKNGISYREQKSLDCMLAATISNVAGSVTKTAASIGYAVPQVGSPFAMTYGGNQLGNVLNAASGVFDILATISNYLAQQHQIMAGYDRRAEEWTLQSSLADFDTKQIDAQLKANEIRRQIAEQELKNHLESIKQNEEMEAFFKGKFTNQQLYQWMVTRLSAVYFQTYNLAFDLARSAQRAFQYEYNTNQSFINFGYWDDLYKGLGAAEGLMLALNQMEKASIDNDKRMLEIEKTISLMQLNPKALLDLKTKGECIFELSEKLFDSDFPGHYCRKIKTLSISIPAVVGPYQNINATLTQLSNQVILSADASAVKFLLGEKSDRTPEADVLRSNWWINQQIALSRGVNDSGLFELNFQDSRFLPFEGTGAVSSWRLTMPLATNRFNFESISDVIIQLKYTAIDGGATFRQTVSQSSALKSFTGVKLLNISQQYSQQWYAFLNNHTSEETQGLQFQLENFIPPHVNQDQAKLIGFYLKLDADTQVSGSYITFQLLGATQPVSVPITLSDQNDFSYIFQKQVGQPNVKDILQGSISITFDLHKTPESLKNGKLLSNQKLKNIALMLYYESEVDMT
jgi:hypothetical protein